MSGCGKSSESLATLLLPLYEQAFKRHCPAIECLHHRNQTESKSITLSVKMCYFYTIVIKNYLFMACVEEIMALG
jgi:hypothetical protein